MNNNNNNNNNTNNEIMIQNIITKEKDRKKIHFLYNEIQFNKTNNNNKGKE